MADLITRIPATPLGGNDVVELHVKIEGSPNVRVMVGRFAQTAWWLNQAGETGISSLHFPGLRLSHCIKILRDDYAVSIETEREPHGGDYPGRHGRYLLRSRLDVVKVVRAGEVSSKRRTTAHKAGGRRDAA
jgi:hypothetical protein